MGRDIRRVPVDFDWPIGEIWEGFLTPERFHEDQCPDCKSGYSRPAQFFQDQWYGNAPFDPVSTGSTALTPDHSAVWDFAARNVSSAPHFYGTGDSAIHQEARRLCALWNAMWSHHLSQKDVNALVKRDRLWDFTRRPLDAQQLADVRRKMAHRGNSWLPYPNGHHPTAAEVNEWSLRGFGHDSLNCGIVIEARCKREGLPYVCATCDGHSTLEKYPGQRAEGEAWAAEDHGPPTGDGWQVWETVSEGSPISPVFADRDGLIAWLMSPAYTWGTSQPLTRSQAEGFVNSAWAPSGAVIGGQFMAGDAMFSLT